MTKKITQFIFDDGEYFAAHLEEGGLRVGMNGLMALDVPAGHDLYAEILGLDEVTTEAFIDRQIEAGRITF